MKHKIALLLLVFTLSGINHKSSLNRLPLALGAIVKTSTQQVAQQQKNKETELHTCCYNSGTRDISDLFDKTETAVRQIDTDKTQLKNIYSATLNQTNNKKTNLPDIYLSSKPQIFQSVSLFLYNRNILI